MEFLDFKGLRYFYENLPKDHVGMLEPKIEWSIENNTLYLDEDTGYTMEEIVDYLKEQLNITELEKDMQRPYIIKQQNLLEKMTDIILKFREITKEDPKLLEFFNKDNRFSNITFAGTHLAAIKVRNAQRQAKELDGEMEESPYSKEQEKLIEEYKEMQNEFERTEKEFENNMDMEV